jgi:outer membrane receptor protein involved in Fe transport
MMKKIVIMLVTLLLLSLASNTLAATLSLDYLADGKYKLDDNSWNIDGNYKIGLDLPLERWKIGLEYWRGEINSLGKADVYSFTAKYGYAFINNDKARVDALICYGNSNTMEINGLISVGIDTELKLSDNAVINGSFIYGVAGKEGKLLNLKIDLDETYDFNIRYDYYFTQNYALSLGYLSSTVKAEGIPDQTITAYTVGVTYKFTD